VENIFLFLPLVITGIIITILLCIISKKETSPEDEALASDYITIFSQPINIYLIIYFFIWITIFLIGLFSEFFIPTLINGAIAAIPLCLLLFINYKKRMKKVS